VTIDVSSLMARMVILHVPCLAFASPAPVGDSAGGSGKSPTYPQVQPRQFGLWSTRERLQRQSSKERHQREPLTALGIDRTRSTRDTAAIAIGADCQSGPPPSKRSTTVRERESVTPPEIATPVIHSLELLYWRREP
jgi:hypothetical protein